MNREVKISSWKVMQPVRLPLDRCFDLATSDQVDLRPYQQSERSQLIFILEEYYFKSIVSQYIGSFCYKHE